MKSQSKSIYFHSRKCIWKCRLENGGHLSWPQCVNSLAPGRCYWNPKLVSFKLISRINILSISCKIAIRWRSQELTDDKSRLWLGTVRQQAITWANVDPDMFSHMSSPDHKELNEVYWCWPYISWKATSMGQDNQELKSKGWSQISVLEKDENQKLITHFSLWINQ